MQFLKSGLVAAAALVLIPAVLPAQWLTQEIELRPGWNSVYLHVDPADDTPAAIFQGLPVESAWSWNKRFVTVSYLTNPGSILPKADDWLVWFPAGSDQDALSDLATLSGGQGYLVKLGGSSPVTLSVTGKPVLRPLNYIPDSLNLVGYTVSESTPPTFQSFFAASSAHAGQTIHRLNNATGQWETVSPTTTMNRNEAFWVYTSGASDYQGPFEITPSSSEGLSFASGFQLSFTYRNVSSQTRTLTFDFAPSATPPAVAGVPLLAGPVPLSRYELNVGTPDVGYIPLAGSFNQTLAAGRGGATSLAVRRSDLAPFTTPAGQTSAYQSLMVVSDGLGFERIIGVSATGEGSGSRRRGPKATDSALKPGLWVGNVTIEAVNQPAISDTVPGLNEPQPVGAKATFRVILHQSEDGNLRLLQDVYIMKKDGVTTTDADGFTSVTEPARIVLVSDESKLSQFRGSTLIDQSVVGRRISSASFGFDQPILMTDVSGDGTAYSGVVFMGYDDPLNPYKHRYHPDHDNRSEQFDQTLAAGAESYDITRELTFRVSSTDPQDLPIAGYGDTRIAGIYEEQISGIHRNTIKVRGTFRIENIVSVGVLNDGL